MRHPLFTQLATLSVDRPDAAPGKRHQWGAFVASARAERGLEQTEAAAELGVATWELNAWELQYKSPLIALLPRIIDWLGYIPWMMTPYAAKTLGERIKLSRELRGYNPKAMSTQFKFSNSTLRRYEQTSVVPAEALRKLARVLHIPLCRIGATWIVAINYIGLLLTALRAWGQGRGMAWA